jgi:hypothetical protein
MCSCMFARLREAFERTVNKGFQKEKDILIQLKKLEVITDLKSRSVSAHKYLFHGSFIEIYSRRYLQDTLQNDLIDSN